MDEALLLLLEKKDFEYITAKEICMKAGVNRSTFYLHYEGMDDLLVESGEYLVKKFLDQSGESSKDFISKIPTEKPDDLFLITPKYLALYLSFIKENRKAFSVSLKRAKLLKMQTVYDKLFMHVLSPILDRFNVKSGQKQYYIAYFIEGLIAIIKEWLNRDCAESIDEIISIIQNCVGQKQLTADSQK